VQTEDEIVLLTHGQFAQDKPGDQYRGSTAMRSEPRRIRATVSRMIIESA
jgi:hypothetical protein